MEHDGTEPQDAVGVNAPNERRGADAAPLSDRDLAKLADMRARIHQTVGLVVLAMANSPRYRHQTLDDIRRLVLDPLSADRIAIVTPNDSKAGETVGLAVWASVSQAVDDRLREQAAAGVFPVRLAAEDWAGGDRLWLLDIIAPSRRSATAVLASFKSIAQDNHVRLHPVIAQSVDVDMLETMRIDTSQT